MTERDQVIGILTKLAKMKPEEFGLKPHKRYRPNFVLVGAPKVYEAPPKPPLGKLYCAGIGVGVSITCLSAWFSLSLYLIDIPL